MTLRKQMNKDASDAPSVSHQFNEESQEADCGNDEDDNVEDNCSSSLPLLQPSSRGKRRREREKQLRTKEMTEEEMMDLALRLSQQEASIAALKLQQEEEAMMKAIEESMVSQTQPCPSPESQSLLSDATLMLSSRRKLLYTNGDANSQGVSADGCTSDTDVTPGDGNSHRGKKRKRKDASPLLEMPDSQAQKKEPQASAFITDPLSVPLDSPPSSDSTQIDDYQLPKSPVFPRSPSLAYRAEVHIPRLSQELLETCKTAGFVLCTQESTTSSHWPLPSQPKSPTFPKSQTNNRASSKRTVFTQSPVISPETDQDEDEEVEQSAEFRKSPVFGRNNQTESPPRGCKSTCANSGFTFCSQESGTSSNTWQGRSPIFPHTHKLSSSPKFAESPAETDHGQCGDTLQSLGRPSSPVFGRSSEQHKFSQVVQKIVGPSAAEHGDPLPCNRSHQDARGPLWCLRKVNKIDHCQDDGKVQSDAEEEPKQVSVNWKSSRTELTSNMTLCWSDEDDDGDCKVSPSPIFPKERATHHQPDSHSASTDHTAAAAGTAGLNCSPNPQRCSPVPGAKKVQRPSTSAKGGKRSDKSFSSSMLPSQQQQVPAPSATGQEARPVLSQAPVATPTVHYYWGVPFCPRGLEPDAYTQVILAQLEVYEKSLKQAQRCLLRKAEWGEAILPQPEKCPSPESHVGSPEQPPHRRRGLRLRGRKMRKSPLRGEDDKKDSEEEERREKSNNEGVEVDIDDCDVCPETQLSDNDYNNTQDLSPGADVTAEPKPRSPTLPEIEFVLRKDSAEQDRSQEEVMEVDGLVDGQKDGDKRQNVRREEGVKEKESRGAEVEEIEDQVLQKLKSHEMEASAVPRLSKGSIACPLCQGSFPLAEIEMHAAYCDGEVTIMEERRPVEDCFQVSLKPRKKRIRKAEATAEETQDPSGLGNRAHQRQERCYVCHKAVLLRDYSRHTEECIPRRASSAASRGNLLSALEETESRDPEAGPSSGPKLQPRDVIDLRDEDEDDEGSPDMSAFRISRPPVRTFTPISEATDCQVDFEERQQVKKPNRRPR